MCSVKRQAVYYFVCNIPNRVVVPRSFFASVSVSEGCAWGLFASIPGGLPSTVAGAWTRSPAYACMPAASGSHRQPGECVPRSR